MKTTKSAEYNFLIDKKFSMKLWMCPSSCEKIDCFPHIAHEYPQYEHLRIGKDVHNNDMGFSQR